MRWRLGVASVTSWSSARICSRSRPIRIVCRTNCRPLTRFDKKSRVFHWRLFKDTVTEIKDVAHPVQCRKGALRSFANFAARPEQDSRIDIALQRNLGAESFSQRGKI